MYNGNIRNIYRNHTSPNLHTCHPTHSLHTPHSLYSALSPLYCHGPTKTCTLFHPPHSQLRPLLLLHHAPIFYNPTSSTWVELLAHTWRRMYWTSRARKQQLRSSSWGHGKKLCIPSTLPTSIRRRRPSWWMRARPWVKSRRILG